MLQPFVGEIPSSINSGKALVLRASSAPEIKRVYPSTLKCRCDNRYPPNKSTPYLGHFKLKPTPFDTRCSLWSCRSAIMASRLNGNTRTERKYCLLGKQSSLGPSNGHSIATLSKVQPLRQADLVSDGLDGCSRQHADGLSQDNVNGDRAGSSCHPYPAHETNKTIKRQRGANKNWGSSAALALQREVW